MIAIGNQISVIGGGQARGRRFNPWSVVAEVNSPERVGEIAYRSVRPLASQAPRDANRPWSRGRLRKPSKGMPHKSILTFVMVYDIIFLMLLADKWKDEA
jgi:hypothetical protein